MKRFALLVASALPLILLQAPARAQNDAQAEIVGFHTLSDHGDRKACIRFGMLIEHNRDMQAAWRRSHPEWFWFER